MKEEREKNLQFFIYFFAAPYFPPRLPDIGIWVFPDWPFRIRWPVPDTGRCRPYSGYSLIPTQGSRPPDGYWTGDRALHRPRSLYTFPWS